MGILMTNAGVPKKGEDHLRFLNVLFPADGWTRAGPYEAAGFPYRNKAKFGDTAPYSLPGVSEDDIATVIFSPADAISGKFAPVCETISDAVDASYTVTSVMNEDGTQSIAIVDATSNGVHNVISNAVMDGQGLRIGKSVNGGGNVYIYASEAISTDVTVPVIMVTRNFISALGVPTVSLSGDILTITSSVAAPPDGHIVYCDGVVIFKGKVDILDLSRLIRDTLPHVLKVKDYKDGYSDSGFSTPINYTQGGKTLQGLVVELFSSPVYNNVMQQQGIKSAKLNGQELVLGTDYYVTGNMQKNAGNYTMTIAGTGIYSGTVTQNWTLEKANATLTITEDHINVGQRKVQRIIATVQTGKGLNHPGAISAVSSDVTIAAVTVTDHSVSILGRNTGVCQVTISVADDANFNTVASVTCVVNVAKGV